MFSFFDNFKNKYNYLKKSIKEYQKNNLENEFLPAVLEITETPPAPLGRAIMYVIIIVFITTIMWAFFSKIDIVAIAPGKIVTSGYNKIIQPLRSGVIANIFVEDGQRIKKGDPLIEIKTEDTEANKIRLEQELKFAQIDVKRLAALLDDNPKDAFIVQDIDEELKLQQETLLNAELEKFNSSLEVIKKQINQNNAEKSVLEAEIKRIERIVPSVKERVEAKRKLMQKKIVAPLAFLEAEQEEINFEEELKIQEKKLVEIKARLETLKSQLEETKKSFRNDVLYRLNDARNNVSVLKEELSNAKWLEEMTTIKAPEDGIIQELSVHTIGGIVTTAQQLMKIVPDNSYLEVEALVLNKDIGFIKKEQNVEIKVDSFPFTKYGTIYGTLMDISTDAIETENLGYVYKAKISISKDCLNVEGKKVKLSPGMTVTAEIKTGNRRLIEFLLAPMIRYSVESMRER